MPITINSVELISLGDGLTGTGASGTPLDTAKKLYSQRFDVSASEDTLTVTANGGTLPSGTTAEKLRDIQLIQRPGGKELIYPDDFDYTGSVITIDSGAVLGVAASYILKFWA